MNLKCAFPGERRQTPKTTYYVVQFYKTFWEKQNYGDKTNSGCLGLAVGKRVGYKGTCGNDLR